MSCLDSLPTLSKCCCCVPLKLGTLIIAVVTMIGCFNIVPAYTQTKEVDSSYSDVHKLFKYIVLVSNIILFIFSIILIYGAVTDKPKTALWWLYALLQNLVVVIAYAIICSLANATAGIIAFIITILAGARDFVCAGLVLRVLSSSRQW